MSGKTAFITVLVIGIVATIAYFVFKGKSKSGDIDVTPQGLTTQNNPSPPNKFFSWRGLVEDTGRTLSAPLNQIVPGAGAVGEWAFKEASQGFNDAGDVVLGAALFPVGVTKGVVEVGDKVVDFVGSIF